jgi:hypothetical protein
VNDRAFAAPGEAFITVDFKDDSSDEMDDGGSDGSGPISPGDCFEGLAITLIQNLANSDGGNDHGAAPKVRGAGYRQAAPNLDRQYCTQDILIPPLTSRHSPVMKVVQLADKLLKKLLAAQPSLYWSQACVSALFGESVTEV